MVAAASYLARYEQPLEADCPDLVIAPIKKPTWLAALRGGPRHRLSIPRPMRSAAQLWHRSARRSLRPHFVRQLATVHESNPRQQGRLPRNGPRTDLPWRGCAGGAQTLNGEGRGEACARNRGQRQRKPQHVIEHNRDAVIAYPRIDNEGDARNEQRQRPQSVWSEASTEDECRGERETSTKQYSKKWKIYVQHARLRGEA